MAASGYAKTTLPSGSVGTSLVKLPSLGATSVNSISASAVRIKELYVDASLNPGEDVTVRLWNNAAPVNGTTTAHMAVHCKAGGTLPILSGQGFYFDTALSAAAVQEKGGLAGTTAPSGTVDVRLIY